MHDVPTLEKIDYQIRRTPALPYTKGNLIMDDSSELFEPIEHDSVADAVVEQIEELIVTGVLREGRRLPSERELAEMMGVSRPKLREALKRLEARNLVTVRHGEGSFIAPLVGNAMSPALSELYARHGAALFDYLEYRREQEGFAAELAAIRATGVDRELIQSIVEGMKEANAIGDESAELKSDIDLHSAIVDASHNSMLIHMMASIYDLTRKGVFFNRKHLRENDADGTRLLGQHVAIADAILNHDQAGARSAARAHIDFVEATLRVGIEAERRENIAKKRRVIQEI